MDEIEIYVEVSSESDIEKLGNEDYEEILSNFRLIAEQYGLKEDEDYSLDKLRDLTIEDPFIYIIFSVAASELTKFVIKKLYSVIKKLIKKYKGKYKIRIVIEKSADKPNIGKLDDTKMNDNTKNE